jgi:hypothetical protein
VVQTTSRGKVRCGRPLEVKCEVPTTSRGKAPSGRVLLAYVDENTNQGLLRRRRRRGEKRKIFKSLGHTIKELNGR